MLGLDQVAIVRSVGTGGAYDTTVSAAMPCRLSHVNGGNSMPERAELAALRRVLFDPAYTLDEHSQLEVSGERWNVVAGTVAYMRGPSSAVEYGRADVVRAV